MKPGISVIVPSIQAATLEHTIRSVLAQRYADWELLVVGQGDDKRMQEVVESVAGHEARVQYCHLPVKGISRAMNEGVRRASGEVVAFTADDCEASPEWAETLAEIFAHDSTIDLVGGAVVAPRRTRRGLARCPALIPAENMYDAARSPRRPPPGWEWIGANVAMRRSTAIQIPFDESLGPGTPLAAGEDTDLKLRLEAAGARMLSTPRAVIHHTYGYRYGFKPFLAHARAYTVGNAAVAAKLTLLGDERGRQWTSKTRRQCLRDPFTRLRPYRLPYDLLRLRLYERTYNRCLRDYSVDDDGLLRRIETRREALASMSPDARR